MSYQQQQVSVDLVNMVYTAIAYLALAGAAWLFLRLVQACFWLPGHMRRQNDVQSMLQQKVENYERYIEECEAREAEEAKNNEGIEGNFTPVVDEKAAEANSSDENKDDSGSSPPMTLEQKQKERRECLEMLKKELKRIQDGGDPYDFSHLLDDEDKYLLDPDYQVTQADLDDLEEREKKKAQALLESKDKTYKDKDADLMNVDKEAEAEPKKDK
ncbi:hypothetical protein QAD02_019042 [Eretmocerus hayati]|uniref:Uncharacterized protein n=1 Tax=Eretmocerus hayati TaxID=131215 RepID=A0ACC2PN84_9HYME|nr:hypothetical protein QAD02_019042 [Eretmocerus hayati]